MKRNMVPLLGIAFVVAIISTGVFYGLFAGKLRSSSDIPGHAIVVAARDLDRGTVIQPNDLRVSEVEGVLTGGFSKPEEAAGATLLIAMKANEPLLQERLAPRASDGSSPGGSVPSGMRAVTVHVVQSESLIGLLRAGSRVDLQAVSEKSGGAELRTVLENVQILAVNAADANGNRPSGAAVTVLIRAQDADMVALADAGSRIRVALRNPLDEGTTPRHALALAALFSGGNNLETEDKGSTLSASPAAWDHPIQLHVRVLDVNDAALEELRGQVHGNYFRQFLARGCLPFRRRGRETGPEPGTKTPIGSSFKRTADGGRGTAHQLSRRRQALPAARAVLARTAAGRQTEFAE